jgi:hypothetical protein
MTTYPAGLSKTVYLDQIAREGVEVGNYTSNDASIGVMPNYAMVSTTYYTPLASTLAVPYNYINWTSGTHTGPNVVLLTNAIPQCALLCFVEIGFDNSGPSSWGANQGVLLRIERSTDGGISWPTTTTQYVMFPYFSPSTPATGLGCIFPFAAVSASDMVIRLGTQPAGYTPSPLKAITASMRIMVYNKL